MTIQHHGSGSVDRKSVDDYSDIPRGEVCKQLVEQLNRNLFTVSSNLQSTIKQMTHFDTRIGHEITSLSSCLQDNLSKCTTSYAPHEEQLVQLDTAKRNLEQLTKILEARQIFDYEDGQAEKLKDRSIDDSLLPTLIAIGENLKIIKELGAKPKFDVETYYNTKDRYLTWKGTEFAVKFGSPDGLDEIFEAFATLNSVKDFHRLYQHHFDQSLTSLLNTYKNIEPEKHVSLKEVVNTFVNQASEHFRSHMSSLCKYIDESEAFSRLLEAWKTFVKSGSLEKVFEKSIENNSGFELLTDLKSVVQSVTKLYETGENDAETVESVEDIETIILDGILENTKKPLAVRLKTMAEAPPLNFRSVSEISTSLENFSYLIKEVSFQLFEIYDKKGEDYILSILKPIFADYTTRLCRMEENSTTKIKLEDYLERISLAGQLRSIVEEYKQQNEQISTQDLKSAKKWMNDRVKDAIRASHRFVTDKMPDHGNTVYKEEKIPKSALPTPQDFVVTATQNLLHLLRFWEEALANENTKFALEAHISLQADSDPIATHDDDAIFVAILDKIAGHVVKKLLQSINDVWLKDGKPAPLSKGLIKEFLCDAEYLRDALIDLRAGTHANLDQTIEKLREKIKSMP